MTFALPTNGPKSLFGSRKAAGDSRTPRPGGSPGAPCRATASWSAAVLGRFLARGSTAPRKFSRFSPLNLRQLSLLVFLASRLLSSADTPLDNVVFSVGTTQLKDAAVTNHKLANGAVTARTVLKKSLTGSQIKSSTLGSVPSASHAGKSDSATDPAPMSMVETTVVLKPESEWWKDHKTRWYSCWAPQRLKSQLGRWWP